MNLSAINNADLATLIRAAVSINGTEITDAIRAHIEEALHRLDPSYVPYKPQPVAELPEMGFYRFAKVQLRSWGILLQNVTVRSYRVGAIELQCSQLICPAAVYNNLTDHTAARTFHPITLTLEEPDAHSRPVLTPVKCHMCLDVLSSACNAQDIYVMDSVVLTVRTQHA